MAKFKENESAIAAENLSYLEFEVPKGTIGYVIEEAPESAETIWVNWVGFEEESCVKSSQIKRLEQG